MVRIPDTRAPARAPLGALRVPTVEATADDFGAGIGRALTSVGNRAFDFAVEEQQREQARTDLNATDSARNQGTLRFGELLAELSDSAAPGAVGFGETFRIQADGLRDRIIGEIHERTPFSADGMQTVTRVLDGQINDFQVRAGAFERESRSAERRARLTADLDALTVSVFRDPESLTDHLDAVDRLAIRAKVEGIPPSLVGAFRDRARQRIVTGSARGRIDRDPAGTLELLRSGELDEELGNDVGLIRQLQDEAESRISQRNVEARAAAAARAGLDLVGAARTGGVTLDPDSIDHRNANDRYYNEVVLAEVAAVRAEAAEIAGGARGDEAGPERIAEANEQGLGIVVDFVEAVGMVPRPLHGQIRDDLRSDDTARVLRGADLIGRLHSANPALLDDFSQSDIQLGTGVATNLRRGFDGPRAVERARGSVQNSDDVTRRAR